jgi:hypothetical protein
LDGNGQWCGVKAGARNFVTISAARDCCALQVVDNVEIVVVRDALVCLRISINSRGVSHSAAIGDTLNHD